MSDDVRRVVTINLILYLGFGLLVAAAVASLAANRGHRRRDQPRSLEVTPNVFVGIFVVLLIVCSCIEEGSDDDGEHWLPPYVWNMIIAIACIGVPCAALAIPYVQWISLKRRMHTAYAGTCAPTACPGVRQRDHVSVQDVLDDPPRQLLGVNVPLLATALATGADTHEIMRELFTGDRFLERATDASGTPLGRLAIISYRCVRSSDDAFTLDAPALRSAVSAAQRADVDYLWLDAWAYRKQPPWGTYRHEDFVRTLLAVMLRVEHVIWLPRSRADAPGEYQGRIWCTFEATIVHLRQLPVTVAGHPVNAQQDALAAHGSLLVHWPWAGGCCGGSVLQLLGKLNAAFYVAAAIQLSDALMELFVWRDFYTTTSKALMFGCMWCFWKAARDVQGQSHRLATNGSRVLHMLAHAAAGAAPPWWVDVEAISHTLPWLPAYDRRDAMTIKYVHADCHDRDDVIAC